jgi:hypothetical protein
VKEVEFDHDIYMGDVYYPVHIVATVDYRLQNDSFDHALGREVYLDYAVYDQIKDIRVFELDKEINFFGLPELVRKEIERETLSHAQRFNESWEAPEREYVRE